MSFEFPLTLCLRISLWVELNSKFKIQNSKYEMWGDLMAMTAQTGRAAING